MSKEPLPSTIVERTALLIIGAVVVCACAVLFVSEGVLRSQRADGAWAIGFVDRTPAVWDVTLTNLSNDTRFTWEAVRVGADSHETPLAAGEAVVQSGAQSRVAVTVPQGAFRNGDRIAVYVRDAAGTERRLERRVK